MNFEFILTFALMIAMEANGLLHVPNGSLSREVTDKCDLTAKPQCSSDCSKILLCVAGVENPAISIICSSSTPYCEKGQCVATPGSCLLKSMKSSFVCTSAGVFPDPLNCSQSHYCSETGSLSIVSECPNGKIFDSKLKICVARPFLNNQRICQKTTCDRVQNDFITIPANPAFYAYCFISATGERQTYLYKCDDEINKVFDLNTKTCKFNCKSIGYYADPLDCSAYHICNGLKFSSRHVHCPPNYYFNGTACLNSSAHCPPGSTINITTSTLPTTMPSETMHSETTMATEEMTMMNDPLHPMTEEIEDTNEESSSPLSTMDMPESTESSMIVETTATIMSTKPPRTGAIWKHMGLISVRVGRLLNLI